MNILRLGSRFLFPTAQVLNNNTHIVDRDAAKYFYEVNAYYGAFELEFNRFTKELSELNQQTNWCDRNHSKMKKNEIDLIPFMRRLGKLDESNINILTITRQGGWNEVN